MEKLGADDLVQDSDVLGYTYCATNKLRVVRDDDLFTSINRILPKPDILQQAWLNQNNGDIEWRDVKVVGASTLITSATPSK